MSEAKCPHRNAQKGNQTKTLLFYVFKYYLCTMNKTHLLLTILVIGYILPTSIYGQDKFETYIDQKHGFSINYPANWQIIHVHNYLWSARSELINVKDKFEDIVQIAAHSLHHSEHNMQEAEIANVYAQKKLSSIEKIPGSKAISTEKVMFKDRPAVKIIYITKNKAGHQVKCSELYMVHQRKIWTFSYTALVEDYDHWLPYVNKMWESFKLSATKK
ncbi:MAG: PsbP-related protein [Bacteroidia bacterium]|nr:PsbP-related protein [Bacteroidia bacterium]